MAVDRQCSLIVINGSYLYCPIVVYSIYLIRSHPSNAKLPFQSFIPRVKENSPVSFVELLRLDELVMPFHSLLLYQGSWLNGSFSKLIKLVELSQSVLLSFR